MYVFNLDVTGPSHLNPCYLQCLARSFSHATQIP